MSGGMVTTRRFPVNGIEILVDESGAGDPLVLVHGFTGHRRDFEPAVERGAGLGRMLAPDLRGHGDATPTREVGLYHLDQLADDLRALLDALALPDCHLLGHSVGGMVALRFVLAHPDRVRSLVLMSTAPDCPEGVSPDYLEAMGTLACSEGMAAVQQRVESAARSRAPDPNVDRWGGTYWEHHRMRYGAMDPEAFLGIGRAFYQQRAVTERLSEIACPTSVLVGEGDVMFLDGADALETGIAGARRVTLPEAGHHPHRENPPAWRRAMVDHLTAARGAEASPPAG